MQYPTITLVLGSIILGILAAIFFGWVIFELQGVQTNNAILDFEIEQNFTAITASFVLGLGITVVVHEFIHGLAFRRYGYTVEYGAIITKGVFYTAALGQFQERRHLIRVALAPLLIITMIGFPILAIPIPFVALTVYIILILNTAGAVGDLYVAWRVWHLPTDTLFFDLDTERMYVFEPIE